VADGVGRLRHQVTLSFISEVTMEWGPRVVDRFPPFVKRCLLCG